MKALEKRNLCLPLAKSLVGEMAYSIYRSNYTSIAHSSLSWLTWPWSHQSVCVTQVPNYNQTYSSHSIERRVQLSHKALCSRCHWTISRHRWVTIFLSVSDKVLFFHNLKSMVRSVPHASCHRILPHIVWRISFNSNYSTQNKEMGLW